MDTELDYAEVETSTTIRRERQNYFRAKNFLRTQGYEIESLEQAEAVAFEALMTRNESIRSAAAIVCDLYDDFED